MFFNIFKKSIFQKIDKKIPAECYAAYDAFLRTQVFNDIDSNLLKTLDTEKRAEIEKFKNFDNFNKIERRLQQKRTLFLDASRQQKAMEACN